MAGLAMPSRRGLFQVTRYHFFHCIPTRCIAQGSYSMDCRDLFTHSPNQNLVFLRPSQIQSRQALHQAFHPEIYLRALDLDEG